MANEKIQSLLGDVENFSIDTNFVLYDGDNNYNTTFDQLKLKENVEITPDFRFAVDISHFKLQYAIVEGRFQTVLNQSLIAGGSVGGFSKKSFLQPANTSDDNKIIKLRFAIFEYFIVLVKK